MNLIGSTPFHETHKLPGEVDGTSAWVPAADIYETDDNLVVTSDLPGVDPEELDVCVENNVLSIRGERHFERTVENEKFHRLERLSGGFERSFALTTPVNADKIDATFQDGVLRICLPKAETPKPKSIHIGSGRLIPFRRRAVASSSRA